MERENRSEDIRFLQKQLMLTGAMPKITGQEDFYDLLNIMKARPKDKRPELVDPLEVLRPNGRR